MGSLLCTGYLSDTCGAEAWHHVPSCHWQEGSEASAQGSSWRSVQLGQSRAYTEAAGGVSGPFWRERGPGWRTPAPVHKWNTKWEIYGEREMRKSPCCSVIFFFAVIFNPSEFFSCCWLQDDEPSTLHQFNKWWNHSSLETKALRTQQCKYNQVCGCLFSVLFKVYWNFQLSDFPLLPSWGCEYKWRFAFEGSFFGHTSGALSLK